MQVALLLAIQNNHNGRQESNAEAMLRHTFTSIWQGRKKRCYLQVKSWHLVDHVAGKQMIVNKMQPRL